MKYSSLIGYHIDDEQYGNRRPVENLAKSLVENRERQNDSQKYPDHELLPISHGAVIEHDDFGISAVGFKLHHHLITRKMRVQSWRLSRDGNHERLAMFFAIFLRIKHAVKGMWIVAPHYQQNEKCSHLTSS